MVLTSIVTRSRSPAQIPYKHKITPHIV